MFKIGEFSKLSRVSLRIAEDFINQRPASLCDRITGSRRKEWSLVL